jgi:hypothetical protein
MKVTKDEYKVISAKKSFAIYLIAALPFLYFLINFELLPTQIQNSVLIAIAMLWLLYSIHSIRYGYLSVKAKQYPPPGTRVLSNWNVYHGKKATNLGHIMQFLGVFQILIIFVCVYWYLRFLNAAQF